MQPSLLAAPAGAERIDTALLEPFLRTLVELIGLQATMAIVGIHGGTLLYISVKGADNEALVALVGAVVLIWIVKAVRR